MFAAPGDRVFPHQLDGMTPREQSEVERMFHDAKEKALKRVEAILRQMEAVEESRTQAKVFRMWIRNFLNWKLDQEYLQPCVVYELGRAA